MNPEPNHQVATDLPEQMLAPVQIAHILQRRVQDIQSWLRDPNHPLTGIKVGNQWRVKRSHLRELIEGNKL